MIPLRYTLGMAARIAVTGANGFVGRHLTRYASALGWEVLGVVRSEAAARTVAESGGRPVVLMGSDPAAFAGSIAGCRAVVHLAQIGAERGGATYDAVNVSGTERVIDAAREAGVPRIVAFSGLGVARYGLAPRCTNRYFLSKLAAEVALFRSDRAAVVFRPSYVVGPGDSFVPMLLEAMAKGEVERPGDGAYRLQPIAVKDAAALVLAAVEREAVAPRVYDLVGPEALAYDRFLERLAVLARAHGKPADFRLRTTPIEEADRQARAGGYQGMLGDELDCLLCDEVSDAAPLEALLGRFLTPFDDALAAAVRAA
jgi:nucleoside-diphosphate-sugar epimerase